MTDSIQDSLCVTSKELECSQSIKMNSTSCLRYLTPTGAQGFRCLVKYPWSVHANKDGCERGLKRELKKGGKSEAFKEDTFGRGGIVRSYTGLFIYVYIYTYVHCTCTSPTCVYVCIHI